MIRQLIVYFISFILFACSSAYNNRCTKFRTGRFISHSFEDQQTVIERTDSIQTETNNMTGHVIKAGIKWINDCEYELSNMVEAKNFNDTLKPFWIGRVVSTKILETKDNYCIYESRMNGLSMRIIDTLYVLKQ